MKSTFIFASLFYTSALNAAGTIDHLSVDNDVVIFSTTEAKTAALPACASVEQADNWSISLNTQAGRAMYTLITTAIAKEMAVAIASAQDCADTGTIERAARIDLTVPSNQAVSLDTQGGAIGVYKHDGVTQIGTYAYTSSTSIHYVPVGGDYRIHSFRSQTRINDVFYFTEDNCTGEMWTVNNRYTYIPTQNVSFDPDRWFVSSGNETSFARESYIQSGLGHECQDSSGTSDGYLLLPFEQQPCGTGPCILKAD